MAGPNFCVPCLRQRARFLPLNHHHLDFQTRKSHQSSHPVVQEGKTVPKMADPAGMVPLAGE